MTKRQIKTSSQPVSSQQTFASRKVGQILSRYSSEYQRPIPSHTAIAFQEALAAFQRSGKDSCILDAGCGTGVSTELLAVRYPDSFIIGVDKSAKRLERGANARGMPHTQHLDQGHTRHFIHVRAELMGFFQLAHEHGLLFKMIFFLYPNPWPKKTHLKRRVHLWPVAPLLPHITEAIECRTNWGTFAIEFARAMQILGFETLHVQRNFSTDSPITLFEKKYLASNHKITIVKGHRMVTLRS
jgi:tRNA G46 methylase TrmB